MLSVLITLFSLLSCSTAQRSGLSLSTTPEYDFVPIKEQSVDIVVSFVAPASVASSDRAPVSITAVLDRSGSMSGRKIELLKASTEFLVQRLKSGDHVGVVSYSNGARTDIPLSGVTPATKSNFRETIRSISAGGGTALSAGLFGGIRQQTKGDVSGNVVKSVILFTDGLANVGLTKIGGITSRMRNELRGGKPPTVYALGFGGDHDASFLSAIAEVGKGSYVFVEDENAIATAIGEVLGGLLTVTAQDISLSFTPLNGARIVAVRGGTVNGGRTRTTFPNLFAEERRDVLVSMRIPVLNDALDNQAILRVTLQYFNVITGRRETRRATVVIDRSIGVVETRPDSFVEKTRLRYRVADDIEKAVDQRERGDRSGASSTLQGTLDYIEDSPEGDSTEGRALASDVRTAKDEVDKKDFDKRSAGRVTAGGSSLTTQRSAGSTGFASATRTSAQEQTSADAASFVGGK